MNFSIYNSLSTFDKATRDRKGYSLLYMKSASGSFLVIVTPWLLLADASRAYFQTFRHVLYIRVELETIYVKKKTYSHFH